MLRDVARMEPFVPFPSEPTDAAGDSDDSGDSGEAEVRLRRPRSDRLHVRFAFHRHMAPADPESPQRVGRHRIAANA